VLMRDEEHSHVSGIPWPARSPELTVSYFFKWRYLKERVHRTRPRTREELKRAIRGEIVVINQQLLRRVF
jgi:hypothetical protein